MFEASNSDHKQSMTTIDSLNLKYGKNTLNIASQILDFSWAMHQNNLSHIYTIVLKYTAILNYDSLVLLLKNYDYSSHYLQFTFLT
ncbi:DUF4113 domain-containing protein [Kordia jejudonensis]|uniref:DUF4113 domain-containing protein n=1 Tax=Kordia jejudonensis TaxID=1348245 RepID=UPI0009E62250|nr:DUF4113 domain-containing protein [Kordia jejudonensis]